MTTTTPAVESHDVVAPLQSLELTGVAWCVLRGCDGTAARVHEIDILVAAADAATLAGELCLAGFTRVRTRGRGTHTFFYRFEPPSGRWTILDVVTRVDLGRWQEVPTDLARQVLARRTRGPVPRPAPADAFWLLVLHCLFDVGTVAAHHRPTLAALVPAADHPAPPDVVRLLPHAESQRDVVRAVRDDRWDDIPVLAEQAVAGRSTATRVLVAARVLRRRMARSIQRRRMRRRRGVRVALMAPDGAGKTTVIPAVAGGWPWPADNRYMGLYPESTAPPPRLPGVGFARRLTRMIGIEAASRRLARRGHLVLLDRHPWDARLETARGRRARLKRLLYTPLRRWPAPDLLVVLDAPGAELQRRKTGLDAAALDAARWGYRRLAGAAEHSTAVAVIDATQSPAAVSAAVTAAIWTTVAGRLGPQPCES